MKQTLLEEIDRMHHIKDYIDLIPKTIKNANFLPIYDLYKNTSDGIHPNQSGHKIVADKFIDSIQNFKI